MPPQPTPPPLPLAADRAALSNQISLLLSRRTALLGSLTAGSRLPHGGRGGDGKPCRAVPDEDFKATRPNDGVGYVRGAGAVDKPRDDLLRSRILGKRKGGGAQRASASASVGAEGESESDDDEGRASVGRAKRVRAGADAKADDDDGQTGERAAPADSFGAAAGDGGRPRNTRSKKKRKRVGS